jgi:two-component system sensor histidine kinase EvgS
LINDILDLSKIEAGRLEISPEPVDLRVILNEMSQIFSQKVNEKNIKYLIEIDEFCPKSVIIDEIRIRQILLNLIGNAVKFTSSGFVKTDLKILKSYNGSIDFSITVTDSGIGISEQDCDRIFESFTQQSGQDSKKYGGTGLGLAISKRLCELMNGNIGVESKQGIGSSFTIEFFDIRYSDDILLAEDIHAWDEEGIIFHGANVLIVDDVTYNRDLVKSYLEKYDLVLYEVDNGEKAIEASMQIKPDIILMDIRMPGINGYEATEIIKSREETKSIPVIALTASTIQSETEKINSTFNGYLRKPVQKKSLINEMVKFLPYSIKYIEHENINLEAIDEPVNIVISDFQKREFNEKFGTEIELKTDLMIMEDLEQLADEFISYAIENNILYLKTISVQLKNKIANFDFDGIEITMNNIKDIFK